MSRAHHPLRRAAAPNPDHDRPLRAAVAALAPALTSEARRRIVAMAIVMREAAASFESCGHAHLIAAGLTLAEIEVGHRLARAALDTVEADGLPEDAVEPFSLVDATELRRFNAARAATDFFGVLS